MPDVRNVHKAGDLLVVRFVDDTQLSLYPTGASLWTAPLAPPPPPPPDPDPEYPDPTPDPPDPSNPPVTGGWTHPLPGATITSPYGPRGDAINGGMHYGLDLSTGLGTVGQPVRAPSALKITVAYREGEPNDFHLGTAGNYVKGHTLDGAYTFSFMHLYSVNVNAGQTVSAAHILGIEGATGNVTGLHLHLEAYAGAIDNPGTPPYGNPIDPLPILRANGIQI